MGGGGERREVSVRRQRQFCRAACVLSPDACCPPGCSASLPTHACSHALTGILYGGQQQRWPRPPHGAGRGPLCVYAAGSSGTGAGACSAWRAAPQQLARRRSSAAAAAGGGRGRRAGMVWTGQRGGPYVRCPGGWLGTVGAGGARQWGVEASVQCAPPNPPAPAFRARPSPAERCRPPLSQRPCCLWLSCSAGRVGLRRPSAADSQLGSSAGWQAAAAAAARSPAGRHKAKLHAHAGLVVRLPRQHLTHVELQLADGGGPHHARALRREGGEHGWADESSPHVPPRPARLA